MIKKFALLATMAAFFVACSSDNAENMESQTETTTTTTETTTAAPEVEVEVVPEATEGAVIEGEATTTESTTTTETTTAPEQQ